MNLNPIVGHVLMSAVRVRWARCLMALLLLSFSSCATSSQAGRSSPPAAGATSPPPATGGPSAGTRAGEGVATGLRYVFGFPMVIFGCFITGPEHWGDMSSGLQKVQDYQPGKPYETGDSVLRSSFR